MRSIVRAFIVAAAGAAALGLAMPPDGDIVKRVNPEEYLVKLRLHVEAYQDPHVAEHRYEFDLEDTPVVFPFVPDGGYHELDVDRLRAELRIGDRTVDAGFELEPPSSLETRLGRWTIKKYKGAQVDLLIDEYITTWDAKVDEKRAQRVPWPDPEEPWPTEVASALQPQMFIQSTSEPVSRLVAKWIGPEPRKHTPYMLAKTLARRVVDAYQPSGDYVSREQTGDLNGFILRGAEQAALKPRGPFADAVCLWVAACRNAGLPARPVIGLDRLDRDKPVVWGEFYLPDAGWISVDFRRLFDNPGRLRRPDIDWPGFGTNPDLAELVPLAHHFHPPTGVISEGRHRYPMLWGWAPRPKQVPAEQYLVIDVMKAPQGGGR